MQPFVFHAPTRIVFGDHQESVFAKSVAALGKKAMVVTGGGSVKRNGIYDRIVNALEQEGVAISDFSGVKPNPRVDDARRGIQQAKADQVEVILPIGGGSTVDCAKLIAAGLCTDADPWDIVTKKVKVEKAYPIAAVITVAATGSEMDSASVITNLETMQKLGWASEKVIPSVSLLNPVFTYTVNSWHTAAGTADIMSHTMENYFSVDESAFLQDSFAEGILRTCLKYGSVAVEEPENHEARANLLWANSWAINGILARGKSQAWSVHPMEHELSAEYDITHGVGLAILTPHWLTHVMQKEERTIPRIARFAKEVFGIEKEDVKEQAKAGIEALSSFFRSLNIPMTLSEVKIEEDKLAMMAENCIKNNRGPIQGFISLDVDDVESIFRAAL